MIRVWFGLTVMLRIANTLSIYTVSCKDEDEEMFVKNTKMLL